ncbi:hypothetical protein FLL45_07415 [Aliikangiella marina]|uniref:Uncharacterized protein n=1 Tax=Aliikangiella marina TaxID=1712262 RepID=A0A545TC32_9GAMM|nr:hypothetical protein [Aliikangiella marina]TQV74783.1 hypothetical protein FLL45_07415 [Aliikangiella marina]
MSKIIKTLPQYLLAVAFLGLMGCGEMYVPPPPPAPMQVLAPQPIEGNGGEFLSPFTSDGVTAKWVDKAQSAETGAAVGSAAGAYAGQKLAENIPFFGSMLGSEVGNAAGREIAIQASGGWEYIKETSDLSFNSLRDMAIWMYANHSSNKHYAEVLTATQAIYPDLKESYWSYIRSAPVKQPQY